MTGLRREVLDWLGDGRALPGHERDLLRAAGIAPSPADWRAFLLRLTLWLGTAAFAAAVVFFFAFNWDALGRFAKFGLVEGLLLAALAACYLFDLDRPAGKASLVLLSLLTGALLALTGQVYQTGADTWELFAWWALLILPWVAVGRFSPLWLLWLAIVDLALFFYADRGFYDDSNAILWSFLALNAAALAAWEAAHRAGVAWLRDDWPPRLVFIPATLAATILGLDGIFHAARGGGLLAWLLWLAAAGAWYRRFRLDLFMLAGAILSAIVVLTGLLVRIFLDDGAGGLLVIAVLVVAMAGGGATWLRSVAREVRV